MLKRVGALALTGLALACATPSNGQRPADAPPPAANAEPIPPASQKKAVILPRDVKLGSGPAGAADPSVATPSAGATTGAPVSPN